MLYTLGIIGVKVVRLELIHATYTYIAFYYLMQMECGCRLVLNSNEGCGDDITWDGCAVE